jgi:hypothetical protein
MPLSIPAARKALKIEITARQTTDLELIGARHYEAHRREYEEAGEKQPTPAEVASQLLSEAIQRELRPARRGSKSPDGSDRP